MTLTDEEIWESVIFYYEYGPEILAKITPEEKAAIIQEQRELDIEKDKKERIMPEKFTVWEMEEEYA